MSNNQELAKVPIDLDEERIVLYVTETQYTGGSEVRQFWTNREDYERTVRFLVKYGSIDWLNGYEVGVTIEWDHIDEWNKP